MSDNKLPPIPQEYFNDNRERFNAETFAMDVKNLKENTCSHIFKRVSKQEVVCTLCRNGWYDQGRFDIKDGKLLRVI